MLRAVLQDVAALAPCREVGVRIDARIVVPVRRRQVNAGPADRTGDLRSGRLRRELPAVVVAPAPGVRIPPPGIPEMQHDPAVRKPALLATALSADEPDLVRELGPGDRVEETVLVPDWHSAAREVKHMSPRAIVVSTTVPPRLPCHKTT